MDTEKFMDNHLLNIQNLTVSLPRASGTATVIDGIDLCIKRGETFALVGESGCGKSMTALAIMQLLPMAASIEKHSQIQLDGENLLALSEMAMRRIRGRRIAMIFQEPMTSLNPVMTIADQIGEVLSHHFGLRGHKKQQRILELMNNVGIDDAESRMYDYPHQFSGGMKQRVMIAMALAGEPELLIADEPTTALDVTIQAQVLTLLQQLQQQTGLAILLITHDLAIVKQMADHIAVMYAGHLIEQATAKEFFALPQHPYSQQLFASLPSLEKRQQRLSVIKGSVPPLGTVYNACRFAERCRYAWQTCATLAPRWLSHDHHQVRCHLYDEQINNKLKIDVTEILVEENKQIVQNISQPLLKVENLKIYFPIKKGLFKRTVAYVKAVDGISFTLQQGQTLAIVGESGSGKTTAGAAILQLIKTTTGKVYYRDQLLQQLTRRRLKSLRQELQIIFQDPFSSMNPRMRVSDIIGEGIIAHGLEPNPIKRQQYIAQLLQQVGLSEEYLPRYPHEFSGGQRQRICIARALATKPKIIICDEPTSALDVSVQAQILNLLKQLQESFGLSYIFISHNISVVAYLADYVAVMQHGKIVEQGSAEQILTDPRHAYTQQLLAAVPRL